MEVCNYSDAECLCTFYVINCDCLVTLSRKCPDMYVVSLSNCCTFGIRWVDIYM